MCNYDIYCESLCTQANASSGAAVNDECVTKFNELQAKRLHRFVTYKLENSKEIVVDITGERAATYEDFTKALPENDCRFAVYDFDYMTKEEVPKSKIFYIFWYCFYVPCIPSSYITKQGSD
jgi:cofilin